MRWEKLEVENQLESGPGKRWGHTCNSIFGGKYLYVFGGYGKDNIQTNDIHVFDSTTKKWSVPVVRGLPPPPRDSHSCTTVKNSLFVFGGTDGSSPLNDLHIFDTVSNTWIYQSSNTDGPEAREGHSAALVGKRLFIFGGCGKSADNSLEVYHDDLYILDTETLVWEHAMTSGTPPCGRDSHTCSSWKKKIIVIGGEDSSDNYLSDVHILDTDTLVWKELHTSGDLLPPRAGHTTLTLGKYLFVFGGFSDDRTLYNDLHMLDIDSGVWTKVMPEGQMPAPRFSVAGDTVNYRSGVFALIGGCNKYLEAMDDMYYLHTEMTVENGNEKLSLKRELKRRCQEQALSANSVPKQKDELKVGISKDFGQPSPLQYIGPVENLNPPLSAFKPSNKAMFEAKVTGALNAGYTIETNIDGKHLRGMLFCFNSSFLSAPSSNFSSLPDLQAPKHIQPVVIDFGHAYNVKGKESTSLKAEKEVGNASSLKHVDFTQPQKQVPKKEILSDLNGEGMNRSIDFGTEIPSDDSSMTVDDMFPSSPNQVPEVTSNKKAGTEGQVPQE